jgi:hypothetical protein
MHFPKFWRWVRRGGVGAWGWSDQSVAAAEEDGKRRLERVLAWLSGGQQGERHRYGYPDRPMREEVVRDFPGDGGQRQAVVTRNSYGCLVLNTDRLVFVDVDEETPTGGGWWKRRRGGDEFEPRIRERMERWVEAHPTWGWRAYRTRAGARLMAVHAPMGPSDPGVLEAFETFGADPLYRKLCERQRCFRARLTPKPWRCGSGRPPYRWPWKNDQVKEAFESWQTRYLKGASQVATCRFLGQWGVMQVHGELADLVAFHDGVTRAESGLSLA